MVLGRTAAIAASWMVLIAAAQLASDGIASASDAAAKPDAGGDFVPQVSAWRISLSYTPKPKESALQLPRCPIPESRATAASMIWILRHCSLACCQRATPSIAGGCPGSAQTCKRRQRSIPSRIPNSAC